MALRLLRSPPTCGGKPADTATSGPPGGVLREAARLVDDWLAESFGSADEASADLVRRIAVTLAPRDEEINRLALLLWETSRRLRS